MRRASSRAWWIAGPLVVLAMVGAGLGARAAEAGSVPRFSRGVGPERAPDDAEIDLAGSGACLPLATELVARLRAAQPSIRARVHDSIGSTGGMRAVRDGAIEVALVSRPLREEERSAEVEVIWFARVPVVAIAHASVTVHGISSAELLASYRGQRPAWPDGSPRIVMLRELGDSAQAAVGRALPGFEDAIARAHQARRFRVLYHDEDLVRAVAQTEGSVGLTDLVQARASGQVRSLAIDGVAPSPEALARGSYPYWRDLGLVIARDAPSEVRELARAFTDEVARERIAARGAIPLEGGAP